MWTNERAVRWRVTPALWIALYIGVNVGMILFIGQYPGPHNGDWQLWSQLPSRVWDGTYYDIDTAFPFVWSPVAAWIMAGVAIIGYWPWFALHLAALWLLRFSPLLLLLTAVSWFFWSDVNQANTFTFVFVAGVLALRGSKGWSLVYLALLLLMPRPVQLPLAAVLLWRDRSLVAPFLGLAAVHTALSAPMLIPWIENTLSYRWADMGYSFSPARWFGWSWLIVGLPLAAFLTWKGRIGWAGMAMSPYLMPQHLLAALWDVRDSSRQ